MIIRTRSKSLIAVVTIATFVLITEVRSTVAALLAMPLIQIDISRTGVDLLSKLLWIVLCIAVVSVLYRMDLRHAIAELGIKRSATTGVATATGFIFASPMLALAFVSSINPNFSVYGLLHTTLGSGVGEEVLFRGFLFGLISDN